MGSSKAGLVSLVLGGARSGKSHFAEATARRRAGDNGVLYVATLQPYDEEMQQRIVSHRAARPASWVTVEAPLEPARAIKENLKNEALVLLDCLTLWATNRLLAEGELPAPPSGITEDDLALESLDPVEPVPVPVPEMRSLEARMQAELDEIVRLLRERGRGLVAVSNEVGMGLVPPYPLGRAYRDLLGRLNQHLAAQADQVFLCFSGIPVELKKLAYREED